jgi:LPS O-antigen subunit length determinant protein (WzzB/FepE family)
MQNNNYCIEEDEIDLRELFKTIWKYKKFIIVFTFIITLLAGVYAFIKPNIYQVDSILEIGYYNSYSNSNSNSKILLENPQVLVAKLKTKYGIDIKGIKRELPYVDNITTFKKANSLIKISTLGLSKNDAKKVTKEVNDEIIKRHLQLIDEYKKNVMYQIKSYQKGLNNIINNQKRLKLTIKIQKEKAQKLSKTNPTLSAIYMVEILKQQDKLSNLKRDSFELQNKIILNQQKLLPINIKPTKVVRTIVYENHVKPKRALIIIVAFITSFILAIFLVFFIEFIRGERDEPKQNI